MSTSIPTTEAPARRRPRGERLSEHFVAGEFESGDRPGYALVQDALVRGLEYLREVFGRPIVVTSGHRTPDYNRRVGGARGSMHTAGRAADIYIPGVPPSLLAQQALKIFPGVGYYGPSGGRAGFVHVDTGRERFWVGRGRGAGSGAFVRLAEHRARGGQARSVTGSRAVDGILEEIDEATAPAREAAGAALQDAAQIGSGALGGIAWIADNQKTAFAVGAGLAILVLAAALR